MGARCEFRVHYRKLLTLLGPEKWQPCINPTVHLSSPCAHIAKPWRKRSTVCPKATAHSLFPAFVVSSCFLRNLSLQLIIYITLTSWASVYISAQSAFLCFLWVFLEIMPLLPSRLTLCLCYGSQHQRSPFSVSIGLFSLKLLCLLCSNLSPH